MSTIREGMPASVRRVDEQFDRWRAGKQKRERIPPGLWRAAAKLCEIYSIHRVSRWLRLNHTALQDRADKQRRRSGRSTSRPAFVEWSLPAGIATDAGTTEYVVDVEGRVPRIHVRGASALEVAALVNALNGQSAGA